MNAYGTHAPILKMLPLFHRVRSVIEFGPGPNSTPVFLNPEHFPELQRLVAFESDPEWLSKWGQESWSLDERFEMRTMSEPLARVASKELGRIFDLAFVDGADMLERAATIKLAGTLAPLVVAHDADNSLYAQAIAEYRYRWVSTLRTPWTAVLSNSLKWVEHLPDNPY